MPAGNLLTRGGNDIFSNADASTGAGLGDFTGKGTYAKLIKDLGMGDFKVHVQTAFDEDGLSESQIADNKKFLDAAKEKFGLLGKVSIPKDEKKGTTYFVSKNSSGEKKIVSEIEYDRPKPDSWLEKAFPVVVKGAILAGAGAAAGAAAGGGMAGGVAGGAAAGAVNAGMSGTNLLEGILTGAATGAIGAGITPAISSAVSPTVGTTVGNAIGRGVSGALTSAVRGTDPLTGAIISQVPGNITGVGGIDQILSSLIKSELNDVIGRNEPSRPSRPTPGSNTSASSGGTAGGNTPRTSVSSPGNSQEQFLKALLRTVRGAGNDAANNPILAFLNSRGARNG